jgi:hypothetical protein
MRERQICRLFRAGKVRVSIPKRFEPGTITVRYSVRFMNFSDPAVKLLGPDFDSALGPRIAVIDPATKRSPFPSCTETFFLKRTDPFLQTSLTGSSISDPDRPLAIFKIMEFQIGQIETVSILSKTTATTRRLTDRIQRFHFGSQLTIKSFEVRKSLTGDSPHRRTIRFLRSPFLSGGTERFPRC